MHSLQCGATRLNAEVMGLWKKGFELVARMDRIKKEIVTTNGAFECTVQYSCNFTLLTCLLLYTRMKERRIHI